MWEITAGILDADCHMAGSLQMSFWLKILFDAQAPECLPPETWPIDSAGSVSFWGYLNQQPKPGGSKFLIILPLAFWEVWDFKVFFWTPSSEEIHYWEGRGEGVTGQRWGKWQETRVQLREQGANPSHGRGLSHFCPWCWWLDRILWIKGTWYLPGRKSVLYAMANILRRGRSYTLSITAASIKAN